MSDIRTALETKIRNTLYPLLDNIFSAPLSELAVSLAENPLADEILHTAEAKAKQQAELWTNALISTVTNAFDENTLDSVFSQIDHNQLLNCDVEKHFLQTEITKISNTITGVLQSVAGVLQGTEFTFGELENNKFLKLVDGEIVSGNISGGTGTELEDSMKYTLMLG